MPWVCLHCSCGVSCLDISRNHPDVVLAALGVPAGAPGKSVFITQMGTQAGCSLAQELQQQGWLLLGALAAAT